MESFPIAPASSRSLWFFIPIAMVLLAAAATLLVTAMGPARARYELSPAGIAFRGDIYGRRLIPAAPGTPVACTLIVHGFPPFHLQRGLR